MKCRYCGAEMRLDDIDRFSPYSTDYYYQCDSCDFSCIVQSSLDSSICIEERYKEGKDL